MASRLEVINSCLLQTGQNVFNNADDGSREWNVCAAAYDGAVEHLLDEHDWKFGTTIVEVSTRTGDSPDLAYEDAYSKPDGCLHVIWVQDTGGNTLDWRIVGNQILVTEDGGILVKFVQEPDPTEWPGLFTKALKHFVMAGIYRGLAHDAVSARAEEKSGEFYLGKARPRNDSEEPGRAKFISGLASARRTRRG